MNVFLGWLLIIAKQKESNNVIKGVWNGIKYGWVIIGSKPKKSAENMPIHAISGSKLPINTRCLSFILKTVATNNATARWTAQSGIYITFLVNFIFTFTKRLIIIRYL